MCGSLISLVAFGVIEMRALTQVLTAGPLLAPTPSVLRVISTPCGVVNVVWAVTVDVPVVGEVMVVVHDPVPPEVVQLVGGLGVEVAPLASTVVNVMTVPSGAFTNPPPSPRLALTWAVKVCGSPTRLVPFGRDLDVGVLEDLGRVAAVAAGVVGIDRERR